MRAAFHILLGLMLTTAAVLLPGSLCPASIVCLLCLAFALGMRARQKDGEEEASELPMLLLAYCACLFFGGVANLAWLLFASHR